jgi:molecular chaperone HtpG
VVNVDRLRPTASREAFYQDERLEATRAELGDVLRNYLTSLPEKNPRLLERFLAVHHLAIKALASEDEPFFELFADWLPFETTQGYKSVREIREAGGVVRYVDDVGRFRQIEKIAKAQGLSVVNAGYVYEAELIARLPEVFPGLEVRPVDAVSLSAEFQEPTEEEWRAAEPFLAAAAAVLREYGCYPELRRFLPVDLPVVYAADAEARFLRSVEQAKEDADPLYSGILESISSSRRVAPNSVVYFNVANPLVCRLTGGAAANVLEHSIRILYVEALLLAQQPLSSVELNLLSRGVGGLVEAVSRP